ncbi:MAG: cytochrome P450 [Actinobacteria bacterium]|nr:cytochrome P450 [Actinomycetota bacterium]
MQLNFFDPAVIANPFPYYDELHRHGPVVRNDLMGAWMVAGHEAALSVLKRPEDFSSTGITQMATDRVDAFGGAATMLNSDPPDHERLRGVVQRAFTPRALARLEPRIEEIVRDLLALVPDRESFDAVNELTYPLPVIVIAELLGVSPADRPFFKEWSDDLVNGINEQATFEDQRRSTEAAEALREYFRNEIAARRLQPTDDLIGSLVRANEDDGALTDAELLAACVILLVAGNETTTKFIGNAIVHLAEHPELRATVVADPSKMGPCVEELIRLVGSVQATARVALVDTEIAGTPVSAGEMVFVMLAAANRDKLIFANPTEVDLSRSPNPHLGFGFGIHVCLGAHLARLESRTALKELLRLAPEYRLSAPAEELRYAPSFFLRGVEQLPIEPMANVAEIGRQ